VSKDAIKKAALELFHRYSYVKTSVSDIAAKSGIGKGSVFLAFKSKEDILFSLSVIFRSAFTAAGCPPPVR
jgi:AcrR family transcriptional regulator